MELIVSGVGVLDKAVRLLEALEPGPRSLVELAGGLGLPKPTAHRLLVAMEAHGLVERRGRSSFVLGPTMVRLGSAAARTGATQLVELAQAVLVRLRDATGESVQLFVRSGESRVCVASLQSPHSLRTIVEVGAVLPMDRGSAAKALLSDPGAKQRNWVESVEEREKGVASVSAPVVVASEVVAAVSVSGPLERTTRRPGRLYGAAVLAAAKELEARAQAGP